MRTDTNASACWHTVVPTALGQLTLVRNAGGLCGLYFPHHWYMPDPSTFGARCNEGFDEAVGQLGEYLAGDRHEFELALAPRGTEFQQRVWDLVRQVPYGDTVTYGSLAGRLDREVTAQEVGAVVARNPLCIVVPCHRVVGRAGKRAGYAGGVARKRHLLDLEQAAQPALIPIPNEGW
jgi:methylated-DNA-[protein]-cysteine S-methyltransferase